LTAFGARGRLQSA